MQLATIRLDGGEVPAGVDPRRGVAPLSALPEPAPPTTLGVLTEISPADFGKRLAAAPDSAFRPLDGVEFLAPYRNPRKVWGIGLNYTEHADDLAAVHPDEPASFMKGDHTII